MRILTLMTAGLLAMPMAAQQQQQKQQTMAQKQQMVANSNREFKVVKQLPITSVKNQYRSGTCWDYGKAIDELGKPFYLVKNTWGEYGPYKGTWYMSRDYMTLNTTYLFLNRQALPRTLQEALTKANFN